jgi:hypothetical protein
MKYIISGSYSYIYQTVVLLISCRIQQLQLLGREMRGEIKDKLWRQLESEILLHRHKTVIRACRGRGNGAGGDIAVPPSEPPSTDNRSHQGIGEPRFVTLQREAGDGLGISITVSTFISLCTHLYETGPVSLFHFIKKACSGNYKVINNFTDILEVSF